MPRQNFGANYLVTPGMLLTFIPTQPPLGKSPIIHVGKKMAAVHFTTIPCDPNSV